MPDPAPLRTTSGGSETSRRPILLVEDDAAHAELISRAFETTDEPVELVRVATIAEARELLAARQPRLLISDLRLPDGDGLDLVLPADDQRFPIVVMTSHGDEQVAVEAMKAGASDYVVKSTSTLAAMPRIARRVLRDWEHVQTRRRLEEQLRQAQKLEGLGRLAGNVAHDFNNLLTIVLGNAQLLRESLGEDWAGVEIDEIIAAGRRAADLARQLLAFARRQPMLPEIVHLDTIVEGVDSLLRRLLGTDIELVTVLAPDVWPIRIDAHQFEQVLLNLAVNGRDAMDGVGRLVLTIENLTIDEALTVRWPNVPTGDHVHVSIADVGPGIDPDVLPFIFEPFFTTKRNGEGTGLGLSICYGIVHQSGGQISAESAPGRGTTFHMFFPRVHEDGVRDLAGADEVIRRPAVSGREIVLLVEDEATVRSLAARTLRARGYTVHEVALGTEAIERARTIGRLDLLVTDVVMPQMSGRQVAARLRAERPDLRILFISGYGPPEAGAALRGTEGRVDFLAKPFTPAQLAERVRQLLDAELP